ncbi:MAG: chemotaxis protein CheC [Gemmatimonadetes bacterium]|nr:chemotaxis protein CheC [Gemmatimonadota bacterium]
MTQSPVTPEQMDAIREVVNIGAGHAATNLSALTGLTVMISVPRVQWADPEGPPPLPGTGDLVVITVPITGVSEEGGERASLILARETALRMVALMLRRDPAQHQEVGAFERSALNEMGNIVCAAYVGVLGTFLGKGVLIGTPEMHVGPRDELADPVPNGLVIETDFTFLATTFEGVFVLSHSDVSFASLLAALGFGDVGRPGGAAAA